MEEPTNGVLEGNSLEAFFSGTYKPVEETIEETPKIEDFFKDETSTDVATTNKEDITPPVTNPQSSTTPSFYDSLVKEMIEDGDWIDGEIELEDGTAVLLSEINNVTPDLFKQIKESQKAIKEEEFKSKYISVEGLDDTTKKMIELKKAGGDITSLLQAEAQYVHPLKGLDLDSDDVQAYLVAQKYMSMGLDQDIVQMKIEKLKKDSQLDLEAKKIIDEVNSNFDAHVESEKNKQLELKRQIDEEQKTFRKTISESFKNLGLEKETLIKNLIEKTAKFDDNGLTEADKLYFESKKNPELHAKIAFLLSDEESFNKFYTQKAKLETKKDDVRKILQISPKSSSTSSKKQAPVEEFFNQINNK